MRIFLAGSIVYLAHFATCETDIGQPPWLLNNPPYFQKASRTGMHDVRTNETAMAHFAENSDILLEKTDGWTDGEVVDAMEHFFWGMRDGVAIELGALDGSPHTRSCTFEYERILGWRRILIEGNPTYHDDLMKNSPLAFSVNAAICSNPSVVHYAQSDYVGGIVEFMSQSFMQTFHGRIYNNCKPPGNLTSFDWSTVKDWVKPVECIPMSHVLRKAHVKHINYFILDVEVRTPLSNKHTTYCHALRENMTFKDYTLKSIAPILMTAPANATLIAWVLIM
jgi:hypothetical protein